MHDPEELRARALEVVVSSGYDNATMAQIAAGAGVSVRTLHRHFPSKADIVWASVDDTFEALSDGLTNTAENVSIAEGIAAAVTVVAEATVVGQTKLRDRVRLLTSSPELQAHRSDAFIRWRHQLTAYIARRLGLDEADLVPFTLGAAAQSAMMAALTWWASHDSDLSPHDAVAAALRGLEGLGAR